MAAFPTDPPSSPSPAAGRVAELAQQSNAALSARLCGWVPGTGYCSNRDCGADCSFAAQRDAEARRVQRLRRGRRFSPRRSAGQFVRP